MATTTEYKIGKDGKFAVCDDEGVINAFRELRLAWFNAHLKSKPHEREWETEESEKRREEDNAELKEIFDEQTEAIILGEKLPISPRCSNDLA